MCGSQCTWTDVPCELTSAGSRDGSCNEPKVSHLDVQISSEGEEDVGGCVCVP